MQNDHLGILLATKTNQIQMFHLHIRTDAKEWESKLDWIQIKKKQPLDFLSYPKPSCRTQCSFYSIFKFELGSNAEVPARLNHNFHIPQLIQMHSVMEAIRRSNICPFEQKSYSCFQPTKLQSKDQVTLSLCYGEIHIYNTKIILS